MTFYLSRKSNKKAPSTLHYLLRSTIKEMKDYSSSHSNLLVLQRGEELLASLEAYATKQSLTGAWLQSGLGGTDNVILSFYDLETRQYIDKTFSEPLEILSLQGNLAWVDGKPFWHAHGLFGTRDYQSIGGHIKQLTIALTGELLITPLETALTREYDETTGLKLLNEDTYYGK